jgi:hypothetical protein
MLENAAFLTDSNTDDAAVGEAKSANTGSVTIASVTATDPVEAALAKALEGATAAREWSTVAQLARELEERRKARSNVVRLDDVRAKKGGAQ